MSFNPQDFRQVMGSFATGVTIITTQPEGKDPAGLTANAFSSLSLEPPLVLICVDKKSSALSDIEEAGHFAVNFLAADQEELSRKFAKKGEDKFQGVSYTKGSLGDPVLDGTLSHVECKVVDKVEGGDHYVFFGEVVELSNRGGDPLMFFKGQYFKKLEA